MPRVIAGLRCEHPPKLHASPELCWFSWGIGVDESLANEVYRGVEWAQLFAENVARQVRTGHEPLRFEEPR